jgi:hypothetical protein
VVLLVTKVTKWVGKDLAVLRFPGCSNASRVVLLVTKVTKWVGKDLAVLRFPG